MWIHLDVPCQAEQDAFSLKITSDPNATVSDWFANVEYWHPASVVPVFRTTGKHEGVIAYTYCQNSKTMLNCIKSFHLFKES